MKFMSNLKDSKNTIKCAVIENIIGHLNGDERVALAERYLDKKVINVFKDVELKDSIDALFANNLNISETSRNAFMHRNTLLYRIDKINRLTGLNIRNFDDAVTLLVFESVYEKTKNLR